MFNSLPLLTSLKSLPLSDPRRQKAREAVSRLLPWTPKSPPQWLAYRCQADELLYGGAAGGGKTDLLLGLAVTRHKQSLILRRESVQLRGITDRAQEIVGKLGNYNATEKRWKLSDGRTIEFGGVEHEKDKEDYRGRAHDLKGFDEITGFSQTQYQFIIGWNRSVDPKFRCRVVCAGNPPSTVEGRWVVGAWAPWVDIKYPKRAIPGELRWYTSLEGKETWVENGEPFLHKGERIIPRSRTFIPARLSDNPFLKGTTYEAILQAYPEPLRSQLLTGDYTSSMQDDPWQVIPTAWVLAAQARWTPDGGRGKILNCQGVDVAYGGADKTVIADRRETWFAPLRKYQGEVTDKGSKAAGLVMQTHEPGAKKNVDVIGYGAACQEALEALVGRDSIGVNVAKATALTDKSGKLRLSNIRAAMWWKMREALDPDTGENLALPDDSELLADLTAAKYEVRSTGIVVEPKEDIKTRLGRSPDCGDALCLAHWHGMEKEFLPQGWGF